MLRLPLIVAALVTLATIMSVSASASQPNRLRVPLKRVMHPQKWASPKTSKGYQVQNDDDIIFNLNDNLGFAYSGTVGFGTPSQTATLVFDTGSSDLWVISSATGDTSHHTYNTSASSTGQESTRTVSVQYGKGSTTGYITTDVFHASSLSVQNQMFFQAITFDTEAFADVDGIWGLSFNGLASTYHVDSAYRVPVENMVSQNLISTPEFGFILGGYDNPSKSEFILGEPDPQLYNQTAGIAWSPLDQTAGPYWTVPLASVGTTGTSGSLRADYCAASGNQNCIALIDSGTSLIIFDSRMVDGMTSMMQSALRTSGRTDCQAQQYVNPYTGQRNMALVCDDISKGVQGLPSLTFHIHARKFQVPPAVYMRLNNETGGGPPSRLAWISLWQFGRLSYSSSYFMILGDVFMQNYYSVFNMDTKMVGFDINELSTPASVIDQLSGDDGCLGGLSSSGCTIVYLLIGAVCLSVILLIIRVIYVRRRRSKPALLIPPTNNQYSRLPPEGDNLQYQRNLQQATQASLVDY